MAKVRSFGKGREFLFFGSFTSKLAARKKERAHPGSFIIERHGRYYVLKSTGKKNPANDKKIVCIYGRVLSIQAQKVGFHRHCDAECKRVNHKYIHDFKTGAKLLGLPDGTELILPGGQHVRLSPGSMLVSDRRY